MLRCAVIAGTVAACTGSSFAQLNARTGSILGLWDEPAKWSLGHTPLAGELVVIHDNSIVLLDVNTPLLGNVNIGIAPGFGGTLILSDGWGVQLNTNLLQLGQDGDADMDMGPSNTINAGEIEMAMNAGSDASAVMSGGDLNVSTNFFVGQGGIAEFQLWDGTVDTDTLTMAQFNGSVGIFDQTGGDVTANGVFVDGEGSGSYIITAGTLDAGIVYCGLGFGPGLGVFSVTGSAEINTGQIQLGNSSHGIVSQNGGTITVGTLHMALAAGGTAEYILSGGVLDAWLVDPGNGAKTFNMTGGTLIVNTWGEPANPYNLEPTGGLILPAGKNLGSMSVFGTFDLGPGAATRFQLDAPWNSDLINVTGNVKLQGSLLTIPINPPTPGDEFLLISNDGVDPVIGTFAGLPEGATFSVSVGSSSYDYTITYIGGNGNDVLLIAADCPPDLNNDGILDNADLSLFVTLFLAGDPIADFNNDTFLDNADIAAFITAFLAGC